MYRRNYAWMFAIIIILSSTYLQLPLDDNMQLKVGPNHNVADIGLLLYLLYFFKEVIQHGFYIKNPMRKSIALFLSFLFLNGVFDYFKGTSLGDVIRYWKDWAFLSIVFINPYIYQKEFLKIFKIIFWITAVLCAVLIVQYALGVVWIGFSTKYFSHGVEYVRGVKPPSTVIICVVIALVNLFNFSKSIQIMVLAVLMLPILLTLKMSYFGTLLLCASIYYWFYKKQNFIFIIKYSFIAILFLLVVSISFPVFTQRFTETINQSSLFINKSKEKGNFSYRIDHFKERFDYVLQDPVRSIRGIGYIQERNFHHKIFKLGQHNDYKDVVQLDTGDIAWSILILRLGILGLIVYGSMYFYCMGYIFRQRESSTIILLLFAYMFASFFFMSMGNTLIANSEFFILPLLSIQLLDNTNSVLKYT